jgi:hypothetical protein
MTADFNDPPVDAPEFPRDQWGRPLIIPPDGGDPVAYTRASSNETEDRYNLELYARRNVVFGMAHDNSLVARALAIGGTPSTWDMADKRAINKIHEDAATIAQAMRKANIGTAVHRLLERADRGESIIPGPYGDDVDAYLTALYEAGYSIDQRFIECRMVCDALRRAGSPDRILIRRADGRYVIGDIKTGESVDYGTLSWAAQLATYAHGTLYDPVLGVRLETPDIDRTTGVIIHLPAGEGVCTLHEIDLVAGYRAAQLDNEVRAIRKESKRWLSRITPVRAPGLTAGAGAPPPAPASVAAHPSSAPRRDALLIRYRALPELTRQRFLRMDTDLNDLDAVEAALDRLEEETGAVALPAAAAPTLIDLAGVTGAVAETPSPAAVPTPVDDDRCPHGEWCHEVCRYCEGEYPTPADLVEQLGRGHDEGSAITQYEFDDVQRRHDAVPPALRFWMAAVAAEANRAGVAFYLTRARTTRRYWLYIGLIMLAEADIVDPDGVRALVARATGSDAPLFPSVTIGHAVGAMNAEEAGRFADACSALVAGEFVAEFTGPGLAMRFAPA